LEFIRISNFVEFENFDFTSGTSLWSWVEGVELFALEIDSPMLAFFWMVLVIGYCGPLPVHFS
jgi:hypothetical protein